VRKISAAVVLTGLLAGGASAQDYHYVAQAGQTSTSPYLSWDTAASNIQDAVDAAVDGDTVLVTNGLYEAGGRNSEAGVITNRVVVELAITVQSVNGPAVTAIRGQIADDPSATRCVYLDKGAILAGFTLTNGGAYFDSFGENSIGGGAFINDDGTLSNCWVRGCARSGVAVGLWGSVVDCILQGNSGINGGGVFFDADGEITRCLILDNTALIGGGVALGAATMRDCLVCGNTATDPTMGAGGGVYAFGNDIINCTIAWNESYYLGGGVADPADPASGQMPSTIINTIIYHNTAPVGSNFYLLGTSVTYSCTAPFIDAEGNIGSPPLLVGLDNPHILAASPCRGAGTLDAVEADETDIDGEPRDWGGAVDIGCDQFVSTNITGALGMNIDAPFTNALVNTTLRFRSAIGGKANVNSWNVAVPGGTNIFTNSPDWTYAWSTVGVYAVTLSATNRDGMGVATVTVTIAESFTNYFDPAGSHAAPFTNWATAATNLQSAIDACYVGGGMVLVQTGTHACAREVFINRGITVRGAGSGTNAVFVGGGTNRCFTVSDPAAVLERVAIRGGYAEEGGGIYLSGGTARQCLLTANSAGLEGGGAYLQRGALMENCRLVGNSAALWGGGVFLDNEAHLANCTVISNWSDNYGGGVYAMGLNIRLDNCYFAGNASWGGGGLFLGGGTAQNCTLVKNIAEGSGGGLYTYVATSVNCIVYFNEASLETDDNYYDENGGQGTVMSSCCAIPLPAGAGNIDVDPLLSGIQNPHILAASPCRAAGDTNAVPAGQTDIDGESRTHGGTVDIGCDEYIAGAVTGAITAAILGDTNTVFDVAEPMSADLSGKVAGFVWRVERGDGQYDYFTNRMDIAPVWTNAGDFQIVLSASNESHSVVVTAVEHVVAGGYTNYVSLSGAHVSPFTDWATAATNIQAAIDVCYNGGLVLVQTGRYAIAAELLLDKAVAVQGVGGPEQTIVDAGGNCRGATLSVDGASLAGLTISNGYALSCGGVYMLGGVLSNCVIVSCVATHMTGGVECHRNAMVRDSVIRGNSAWDWPGGLLLSGNGRASNCVIEDNTVHNAAGGIYFQYGGRAVDCTVRGNGAARGGGLYFLEGGEALNCLVFSNAASEGAGAWFDQDGFASNCVFQLNWGVNEAGGAWFSEGGEMVQCSILNNHADIENGHGGGVLLDGGGTLRDCVIASNEAAFAAGVWFQSGGEIRRSVIQFNNARWGGPDWNSAGVAGGFYMYAGGTLADSLVSDNFADQDAGGGVIEYSGFLAGCSIVNNTASNHAGGVMVFDYGNIVNSIIWSNRAAISNNYYLDLDPYSLISISNSCSDPLLPGTNNLAVHPQFADAAAGNWRLHWDSPCVDAGADLEASTNTDLAGNPRLAGAHEDLGAYELQARDHLLATTRLRRMQFTANWRPVTMATNYWLDVACDSGFADYAPGYQNRNIGLVTNLTVTNLNPTTPYYVRVRVESAYGVGVNSTVSNIMTATQSLASGQNAKFDWDGDGKADLIVFNPLTGQWAVLLSGTGYTSGLNGYFSGPGFTPVCGDYNGDTLTDPGVYGEASGLWQVLIWNGADFDFYEQVFGGLGYAAAPGDFDGDEKTDLTVYYEATGLWGSWFTSTGLQTTGGWGGPGMKPAPADFNGDGKTDPTVYQATSGMWYALLSGPGEYQPAEQWFGGPGMAPAAADYDGDGKADAAVYEEAQGNWYVLMSGDGSIQTCVLGGPGWKAVPADYNGDGKADPTVYELATGAWIAFLSGPDGYTLGTAMLGGADWLPLP